MGQLRWLAGLAWASEPRTQARLEIEALRPRDGWLPFKDVATQRSEQGGVRGDVKTMGDRLPNSA